MGVLHHRRAEISFFWNAFDLFFIFSSLSTLFPIERRKLVRSLWESSLRRWLRLLCDTELLRFGVVTKALVSFQVISGWRGGHTSVHLNELSYLLDIFYQTNQCDLSWSSLEFMVAGFLSDLQQTHVFSSHYTFYCWIVAIFWPFHQEAAPCWYSLLPRSALALRILITLINYTKYACK